MIITAILGVRMVVAAIYVVFEVIDIHNLVSYAQIETA